jgi:hypothetical protein
MKFTFDYDLFSDLHKDAYGFRPHSHFFYDEGCSDERRQKYWDMAIEDLEIREQEDRRAEERAVAEFEAGLKVIMAAAGCDRATAIRYQIEAMGMEFEWDPGYICFELGLPYHKGYEEEFLPFIRNEREAA